MKVQHIAIEHSELRHIEKLLVLKLSECSFLRNNKNYRKFAFFASVSAKRDNDKSKLNFLLWRASQLLNLTEKL